MKILIADDSREIRRILCDYVRAYGYTAAEAENGEDALSQYHNGAFDIILLDVMMPKIDGFEVCRRIRRESKVPIIMITAKGEDFDKIMGLDIGADDYIVKPFSPGEVMARIRAVMRRIEVTKENEADYKRITIGSMIISMEESRVTLNGKDIQLTKKELELLWTMAEHKGMVFTRDHLVESLWGYDYEGDTRTVDSHMKRLRAKLDTEPHDGWSIKTVWGVGYKLEVSKDEV